MGGRISTERAVPSASGLLLRTEGSDQPRRTRRTRRTAARDARGYCFLRVLRGHHCTEVMSRMHVFGIRHHGPGSARSLERALARVAPDIVLIEGPPEADELIALAADEAM